MAVEIPTEGNAYPPRRRVYRPADYYSSASPERVLPQWAPFGCGAASVLILIIVFAGGAWLASGGFTQMMDLVIGMTMGEMRGMLAKDVTAAQKDALEREIETLRKNLREEKVSVQKLQPLLEAIRKATDDKKVDPREVDSLTALAKELNAKPKGPWPPVATFSILGYDPKTGEVGAAVQSRVFSVGNGVLWAEAGAGVVATQAVVDVSYGPQGLSLLRAGLTPAAAVKAIWDNDPDPRPEDWTKFGRQFAIMDANGNYAAYTGPKASAWAGNKGGKFCTAQGNILAGEPVVAGMVEAFEKTEGHLSYRLMAALDAGQKAGGDTRGMQSAAMVIVKKNGGVWLHNDVVLRLQVDDNPEPLKELRRLLDLATKQRERIAASRK